MARNTRKIRRPDRHRLRTFIHSVQRFFYGIWRRTIARPATKVGIVLGILAMISATGLHYFEKNLPTTVEGEAASRDAIPYATFSGTIRSVVVLLISGFDVYPPSTMPGWVCATFTMLLGIALVALLTADLASHLVRTALGVRTHGAVSLRDHFVVCGWSGLG